jgi:DNA-3-methyladenine glycosylase
LELVIKLARSFYQRDDVIRVSRELLGKVLCTRLDGVTTHALITETEAYRGETDRACHAYGGRRTARTEPMYSAGGRAYVYLCYGIHHLFNVVTAGVDTPHAVLVRAGVPLAGTAEMLLRRGREQVDRSLLGGPGSLARALAITTSLTGEDLQGSRLWIEDQGMQVAEDAIRCRKRVGVDYAGEDAALPWRFSFEPDT